jgi:hypothetical protein
MPRYSSIRARVEQHNAARARNWKRQRADYVTMYTLGRLAFPTGKFVPPGLAPPDVAPDADVHDFPTVPSTITPEGQAGG